MAGRMRQGIVTTIAVLSVLTLLLGTTYTYVARTFFNADVFASRVADGLQEPELSAIVAGQLADEVISLREDLIAYRPLIVGALQQVVRSTPFRAVVRRAVKETHETIISETGEGIALTASDLGVVVRDALKKNPEIAKKVPAGVIEKLGSTKQWVPGKVLTRVLKIGQRLRTRAAILLLAGFVFAVLGFVLAIRKDTYLLRFGILMAVSGFVIAGVARFGAPAVTLVMGRDFSGQLARGLWPTFIGPLSIRMWIFCAMGIVTVAGVTSTFSRINLTSLWRIVWRGVGARPRNVPLSFLRGTLLAILGVLVAFNPTPSLQIAVVAAAAILFFFGIQEIFAAIVDWLPRIEHTVTRRSESSLFVRGVLVTVLTLAVIGAGVLWLDRHEVHTPVTRVVTACNGNAELCDRPLNQVAFATTHNSMGGADIADWMFPNQEAGIPAQLNDGVRGFLIDVHYGIPIGNRVKTVLDTEVNSMEKYEEALGKEGVAAAMRIRERLVGEPTGEKDVYLAHGFCELGATRFVDALEGIRDFLVMHPGEIIVIIIQDEGVTPADVASCFERSGLLALVYKGPVQKPWPTLREMVDSNQRVLVLAENHWEGVPWYHGAYEVCQETPYKFEKPEDMSNQPNRGGTTGSLLLLNNWIETTPTPLPSNAAIVNSYDFLLKRALACKKQRGMMPNLVAVDFYRTGDLFRVVDALNGVEEPQSASTK